ncbi:kelch repeat and BTB domain-containing protein 8-like [Branchiostoma lanceolatum]|uniref:kelch repeat and BTB domain-containing protein 8-like n=1 Tax=Branchiostoma lanceolatum TaxID=7740 RepID=UPI0034527FFD
MAAAPHVSAVRPRSYQDESYLHGFLGTVSDLQKAGVLQDVVLEVEGRRFPCHRLVLSAASPYFRAMFTSDMAESRQKTVVLQGLDKGIFGEILSYIYSATLHVSLDKVQSLYQTADLLQLDYVRDTCSSYMAMNVERSTCVDLYHFGDVFSVDRVLKSCLEYINRNFAEVASSKEFCSLSVDQLTEIISHDELDVKEETTVWEAVVRWVQHSREDRLNHLPSILPHIRFNLLTSDDTAAILEHPLVREDPVSSEVIRNVEQIGNSNLKPRLGISTEMVLLCNDKKNDELLFMNPREGKYISCSYDPKDLPPDTATTVTSDNNIYILTHERENNRQLAIYKYNHPRNVWEHSGMSSVSNWMRMENNRIFPDEYILEVDRTLYYLAADLVGDSGIVLVRKYSQHPDQWQECSRLQLDINTSYYAVLSCGSHLYLITSTEVHRYDPSQDCWCRWSPSPKLNPIFCTDADLTQTMVYHTELNQWQKLPGLSNTENLLFNSFPSLFVLANQLHILITFTNNENEDENLVYVYDRSADAWRDLEATLPDCDKEYFAPFPRFPVARIYLPYLNVQDKDT